MATYLLNLYNIHVFCW